MQTRLEFSRGAQQRVRAVVDTDRLVLFWEAMNYRRLGQWSHQFSTIDQLRDAEDQMARWLAANQFVLEDSETNG